METKHRSDRRLKGAFGIAASTVVALALFLSGCKDFSFFRELGMKGMLSISPQTSTVVGGGSLSFSASGGVEPYAFSMAGGSGSITAAGLYTAPLVSGPATVRVTDSAGATAVASITVVAASGSLPNYRVKPVPSIPASGTGGMVFSCTFVIENIGDDGAEDVSWNLYISADGSLGAGDFLADQGVQSALSAGGASSSITCSGTWPPAAGNYHLLIQLAASDDPDSSNNGVDSGAISVTGLPAPDYEVTSVMPATPIFEVAGAAFGPYTFTFTNNGTGAGTIAATWEVYLSSNQTIGAGDQFVASGTVGVGSLGVGVPNSPTFAGAWPAAPGTFYLVARVSAVDDPDTTLNTIASEAVTVQLLDVDYEISAGSVTAPANATAGSVLAQSFDVHNRGSQSGSAVVLWEVYASPGNATLGDAGDILIASNSRAAVAASATQTVNYGGSWPGTTGSYYLVVRIRSTEDTDSLNDTGTSASPISVNSPAPAAIDYSGTLAPPTGNRAGGPLSGALTIVNSGSSAGVDTIYWSVYVSKGDTNIDAGDKLVGSGSITGGLPGSGGSSGALSFSSTWPSSPGTDYYLLARILADDDVVTPNLPVLGPITIGVTDYSGTVTWNSGTTAGSPFTAGLTISNIGGTTALAGSATIYWNVYASMTNTTIDAGDKLVGSGSIAGGLGVGATWGGPGNISSSWPSATGTYYLLAEITAVDDSNTGDNRPTSAGVVVNLPIVNYTVSSVTHGAGTITGGAVSGALMVGNTTTGNGSETIHWTVYGSLDGTIGADDAIISSGTWVALPAMTSSGPIPFSGYWPYSIFPVSYHLLARISAADDSNAGDNERDSGPIALSPPGVNYAVTSVTVTGGSLVPDQPFSGQFAYQNVGTANGNANQELSYSVYASRNITLDATDTFVASGSALSARNAGDAPIVVPFGGAWPLDYGNYYLIVELSCAEDVNPGNDRGTTAVTTAVGYFNESLHEPNNDYAGLTNEYNLGVTFRPGMSIRLTGTMSSGDMDDIMSFNTGTATKLTYSVYWSSGKTQIRICLMDAPNNFLIILLGLVDLNSLNWNEPVNGVTRYLNLDNRGDTPAYNGAYTCIISAD